MALYNSRYCILILLFSNKPVVNKSFFFPESFIEQIESWKKDKFFETSAVATILEEVRKKSFVVITGPSGMGKSTIVKLVALQLQKTKDYHILPVICPTDIVKYFDRNIKQIYIIDDICGKFSVDQSMINSWERVKCQILKYCKNNKDFRVLGTCRLEISISGPFRKFQKKYEMTKCNLLQEKFLYSKEEKLKIAACHIDEETIKQLDDKILNAYNMFPLLCMMFAASESKPGVRFFEYPLQAIEEQLDEMNEQNECCFIGLALIVVYNNKLYKHLLQNGDDKKFEDVFNKVFEELGLRNKPSKSSVLSDLLGLEGIYTKELESTITVIHDKIFDIFSLYFGKKIPKTILTHGSGTFIAERFLFKSIEDCDDLKIVLPSELKHSYFNRMMEEIENNRFYNVFKNVQVCNELYQEKFISFLSKYEHQSIVQKLHYNKWPLYLSAVNGGKLLVQFILNEKRRSGMCNKLDKDGNHQDMLMDKPESDMYACNIDTDNDESTTIFYDTDDDKRNTEVDAYRIKFENSPMVAACEGGYIDIVECLVENGYNIDHSDRDLPTPLFSACKYGNKDVVDFLLKRNCKVNAINKYGQTALHVACTNGNIDIVNSLLKCNSSINLRYGRRYTPLYNACIKGHTDIVQILLDNNCDIHGAINGACEGGYKDIVEILIKHNVDINQRDGWSNTTPIYYACSNGHTDIVQILLDNNCDIPNGAINGACEGGYKDIVEILIKHNVDINQRGGQSNKTPLYYACHNGHTDIVQILLDNNCDIPNGDINGACERGYKDIVEILIKHNVDINQRDGWSNTTPICYACSNGHTDIVQILLDNNCDIPNGAINGACEGGYKDIVEILIKHNVDINQRGGWSNKTPIYYACHNGHTDIVQILLDNNCDIPNGAINGACEGGYKDIVEILIKHNVDINQRGGQSNKTPLYYACHNGHTDIVQILLDNNCDIPNGDINGACERGYKDIVEILIKHNVDINQRDGQSNKTPIYSACSNGHTDIVQILLDNNCDTHGAIKGACEGGYKDIVEILMKHNVDINQCDGPSYRTPIYCACRNGHTDIVQILLDNNCDIHGAINGACAGGYKDIVEILMKRNVDINQHGGYLNQTPIYSACHNGHTDIVQILLDNNCDIHGAINGACEGGYKDIVEILIKHNVDINQPGGLFGKTPIYYACHNGHTDIVQILLDNNCDIHGGAINGACEGGYKDIVEILIKHNVDINQRSGDLYQTPIYYACHNGHTDIVQILLDNKCDIHGAINGACEGGYKDIVEILMKHNVDINQRGGQSNKTPIYYACRNGHTDIVQILLDNNCDIHGAINGACEGGYKDIVEILIKHKH